MSSGGGSGGGNALGPYVRYRIRTIPEEGRPSEFLTMARERVSIPSPHLIRTRIRTNKGEWVTTQNEFIDKETIRVRIRSIEKDGGMSPWVYGDRGTLQ